MTIQYIAWNNLVASKRNRRKVKADVAGLALNLAADGLLQNLVVLPREDGKYEVIAGERRRRAIVQLVKSRTWERDVSIPCEVREPEAATSISYAENAQRVGMHPADSIRAFAALRDEGYGEEAIANRYGYDVGYVRKLLAMAGVSPKVINALASDKIDLACVQAFTLTGDHKRQERILKRYRTAHQVRKLLTESKLTTGSGLFRYVGTEAYQAAGGTITGDLFSAEGDGYADDAELVQRLADEKMDALEVEARAKGWGEVIVTGSRPYAAYQWDEAYPDETTRVLSDADNVALARLQTQWDERLAEIGAEGDEDFDPNSDDVLIAIHHDMAKLGTVERHYSDEAKQNARLLIVVKRDGTVDATAYARKKPSGARSGGGTTGTSAPRPLYDARMTEQLSRIRTVALQSEVARNQRLANAVLLDALLPILIRHDAPAHAVQLRASKPIEKPSRTFDHNVRDMASPFDGVVDLLAAMPKKPANRFAWVLGLDEADVACLLAACTAALIDGRNDKYSDAHRLLSVDRIARAANLDMRDHWEGGIEFFGAITKKAMLAALSEACSPATAEDCAKLPKPKLAETCAERIPGRGWLPPALITPEQPEAEAEDQAPEDQAPEDQAPEDQADDAAGDADMADTEHGDEAETLDDDQLVEAVNDDEPMAVAAE